MATSRNLISYWQIWAELKARLDADATLTTLLQGGKTYIEGADYSQPERPGPVVWARLVLVPTTNPWIDSVGIGPTRNVRFLTRAEVHSNNDPAFVPQKTLDGIQNECVVQLEGFVIPRHTLVMGASAIWLARPPQALPLWDNDSGVYFTSAEWRCEVAAP